MARLIINPSSGGGRAMDWLLPINQRIHSELGGCDIVITTNAEDGAKAAEEAARRGDEYLFVAGGDGTLNEAINGVAKVPGALDRLVFGLIPCGTGNDYAGALNIPKEIDGALDALFQRKILEVDLGLVNERGFVNASAGGFIAEVSEAVTPEAKKFAGKLAYLIGGVQQVLDYEPADTECVAIDADGKTIEHKLPLQMFAVTNGPTIGGGRPIAPHAIINDHLFDVVLVEAMSSPEFIAFLAKIPGGNHLDDPRVRSFRAQRVDLRFSRGILINTDGEVLECDRCHYTFAPRAVRILAG